jgi:argininosuccinate lyase
VTTPDVSAAAPAYVRTPAATFLASLPVDRALARVDVAGSIAHVEMLGHVGLLASGEVRTLAGGLRRIVREIADGTFPWRDDLEDVHTNIEVRLTEIVGPVGGKLHTARSRNDQVALDERLFIRATVLEVGNALLGLERRLLERGAGATTVPLPGYTHLQRAQLVSVGHWWLAHFWRFERDLERLLDTARRADVSPLGAGALAGSTLAIDPADVARRLGFARPFDNSLDAVSDRDALAELAFDLALLAVHASGLGEEIVLYASKEFGYLDRTPALGSGSSLMPQKRNPDVAELARGKAGRVIGDLVALLTTLKGLPLAYNRDLQEDKAALLDAIATVRGVLGALGPLLDGLSFRSEALRAAASDPELYATDRAEALVASGMPFREAHASIAAEFAAAAAHPGGSSADRAPAIDPVAALARRRSPGGPGSTELQLARARTRLSAHADSLSSLGRKAELVEELLNEGEK